jgi:hypothetical protein
LAEEGAMAVSDLQDSRRREFTSQETPGEAVFPSAFERTQGLITTHARRLKRAFTG